MPPRHRGLLARLDALVALAADRHGLALLPDGRLAAAEARVAIQATGLARPAGAAMAGATPAGASTTGPAARAGGRGRAAVERDAVELLRCVAEGVGLLRARGDRLEATSLRNAWAQIDEGLRAGLVYAAWCQQVTLTGLPLATRWASRVFEATMTWRVRTARWDPAGRARARTVVPGRRPARRGVTVKPRSWHVRQCWRNRPEPAGYSQPLRRNARYSTRQITAIVASTSG
jgi:hypothetical protein